MRHVSTHTGERQNQCSNNDKASSDILTTHIYSSPEKVITQIHLHSDSVTEYSCSECDYKSTKNDNLKTHMLLHKLLNCSECEYTCKGKDNMKLHMLLYDDHSKEFSCFM